ncbi:hypothetical protein [Enterobacter sp. R4-368]|uniref:hypothetical protein n=1 Tax=Enterobacter sp. R4-368 TaxID=1166130 RepID=UPI00034ED183|nr:hypothetical protein [Enterobacter sp. R4-368]AGN88239.1 hypothetical protein H650_00015 [Enterobacter sp. R4-368]
MRTISSEEIEGKAQIITEGFKGIFTPYEAFYIHSLLYCSGRCLESFNRYEGLKNKEVLPEYLISITQEAVGHAAALSRFFWPSPQGKKTQPNVQRLKFSRGERLRTAFDLDENSALFNRDLRNAWEHFDERLDLFLLEKDSGIFFPECRLGSHMEADEQGNHIFKLLDPNSECLVLMGAKYFFTPIRDEVSRIHKLCLQFDENGGVLR